MAKNARVAQIHQFPSEISSVLRKVARHNHAHQSSVCLIHRFYASFVAFGTHPSKMNQANHLRTSHSSDPVIITDALDDKIFSFV